jgi:hypothetical protein
VHQYSESQLAAILTGITSGRRMEERVEILWWRGGEGRMNDTVIRMPTSFIIFIELVVVPLT